MISMQQFLLHLKTGLTMKFKGARVYEWVALIYVVIAIATRFWPILKAKDPMDPRNHRDVPVSDKKSIFLDRSQE